MAEIEAKLADLTRLRDELSDLAAQCRGGSIRTCRIIDALAGQEPAR